MELIDTYRPRRPFPRAGRTARRVLQRGADRASARKGWMSDRRDYRQLLSLDDRLLRDIGITRDMVHHEMQKPFHWLR